MKHSRIVRPKLKPDSCQNNIEPDFSQNNKGNFPVSDLHREKKKSKCKNCSQLVLDYQYSSYLKFCMKCCGLIAKTEEGYNCSLCSFKSSSEFSVFQHIKKTHLNNNNRERFECGGCCEKLLIRAYVRHLQHCKRYYDFIEKNGDNYKCKLCLNITYKNRFSLCKHMKQHPEVLVCDDYRQSLKRKRDPPVKHSKIVRPKLKPDSCQSNIEPDFSQNRKGSVVISDLHHEKKKSKGEKINCKNCSQLVLDCQYSSYLKFCMKCCGLIAKTEEGYNCSLCPFKSSSEFSVFQHNKKTHIKSWDKFECGRCCEKLEIRDYVWHMEHCKHYYDFIEKIDDANYKCKLCLNKTYKIPSHTRNKKRFPLYHHLKQHNLDNRLPDPEVLQNDGKAKDAMEEKE